MKLGHYLSDRKISYQEFADRIGAANAGVISKYVAGKRYPRPKFLRAIAKETDGEVQANDFLASVE